ncbi:MAG: hypothetical protein N2234_09565 [Planctomycetota bacterium]|nr:hypothetical protein [Planctomycetota bacterium]
MMRLFSFLVSVLVFLSLPTLVFGESVGDIRWRYWKPTFGGKYSVSTDALEGTDITPQMLDFSRHKSIDRFDTTIFMRSSRLSFSLWEILYKGGATLSNPVAYGGTTFDSGPLNGKFRLINYGIRFDFDVLKSYTQSKRTLLFAFGGGFHFLRVYSQLEGSVSGTPKQETARYDQVIPYLSLSVYTYLGSAGGTGDMFVGASVVGSSYSYSQTDIRLSHFTETTVFFQYGATSAFQFGFIRTSLDMERSKSESLKVRYHIDGWFVGIFLSF